MSSTTGGGTVYSLGDNVCVNINDRSRLSVRLSRYGPNGTGKVVKRNAFHLTKQQFDKLKTLTELLESDFQDLSHKTKRTKTKKKKSQTNELSAQEPPISPSSFPFIAPAPLSIKAATKKQARKLPPLVLPGLAEDSQTLPSPPHVSPFTLPPPTPAAEKASENYWNNLTQRPLADEEEEEEKKAQGAPSPLAPPLIFIWWKAMAFWNAT